MMCSRMQRPSFCVDGTSRPGGEIDEEEGKNTDSLVLFGRSGGADCSMNETSSNGTMCLDGLYLLIPLG